MASISLAGGKLGSVFADRRGVDRRRSFEGGRRERGDGSKVEGERGEGSRWKERVTYRW